MAFRFPAFIALFAFVGSGPARLLCASDPLVPPLPRAHAHNDYLHQRPLLDALAHGFTSVEADVFLVGDELLVAHTERELKPENTLRRLYLEPLRQRIGSVGGSVYPGGGLFQLLIDIKSDAEPTYAALSKTLAEYGDIVTVVRGGRVEPKAIQVVVSGNRPIETMAAQTVRYAGVDGRMSDLDSDLPVHLMPLLSDRWSAHFQWQGQGPIDPSERRELQALVADTHAAGRRIRFWATPETQEAWQLLHKVGVDHINTDDLQGLESFLRRSAPDTDASESSRRSSTAP